MATKRAKTLNNDELYHVLTGVAKRSKFPLRDYVVILLGFKGGLRVGEIAGLDWSDVTNAFGIVRQDAFRVPSDIAKKGSEREVPMHPALYAALVALHNATPERYKGASDPVVRPYSDASPRFLANSLQKYIGRLYASLGLESCSSHSGRRSFITAAAQQANLHGCSIRDVQALAGHRDIETTEVYIGASPFRADLVRSL
jgi:integrase